MVVENSLDSHEPVEIGNLRPLTIQGCGAYFRVQPGAERPLTGR